MKPLNKNNMKSKEEGKGFNYGMGTMLMTSIGMDLVGQGSWFTYVGLALIIVSSIIVYTYIKSE
jgi:hypothetical protein